MAVTNSQSNRSSHALLTAPPETALDLVEGAHAFALQMTLARDGIDRRSREAVLNLQPISHDALQQLALTVCHEAKLSCRPAGDKTQSRQGAKPSQDGPLADVAQVDPVVGIEVNKLFADWFVPELRVLPRKIDLRGDVRRGGMRLK